MEHPPLAVTAHRQRDVGHGGVAQRGAAIGLLPRPHAVEEVVHMLVVALVAKAGHDDFRLAPLLDELLTIGLLGDDLRVIELPVLGSFPFVAQEHGGLGAAQHGDGPDFVHLRRFHRDRILASFMSFLNFAVFSATKSITARIIRLLDITHKFLVKFPSIKDRKSTRLNSSHSLHDALPIFLYVFFKLCSFLSNKEYNGENNKTT